MLTTTVAKLTTMLPHLTTLSIGAHRTARKGKRVRLYRSETVLVDPTLCAAVRGMLENGSTVKVYEGTTIFTPALDGETVVWHKRTTKKNREQIVVELTM